MKGQIRFKPNRNLILFSVATTAFCLLVPCTLHGQTGGNGQFNVGGNTGFTGQPPSDSGFQGQPVPNSNQETNQSNVGNPASGLNNANPNQNQQQTFHYRVKIDDRDIEGLLLEGKELEALIPEEYRGRVDKVIIEYVGTKYKNLANLKQNNAADNRPGVNEFGQSNQFGNETKGLNGRIPADQNPTAPFDRFANVPGNNQNQSSVLNRRDSNTLNNGSLPTNKLNNNSGFLAQPNPSTVNNPPQNNGAFDQNAWQANRSGNGQNSNYVRKFAAQDSQQSNYGDGSTIQIGNLSNAAQNQQQAGQYGTRANPNTINPRFGSLGTELHSPGAFRKNAQAGFQQNQNTGWQNVQSNLTQDPGLNSQANVAMGNNSNTAYLARLENMVDSLRKENMQLRTSNGQTQISQRTDGLNAFTNIGSGMTPGYLGQNGNRETQAMNPGDSTRNTTGNTTQDQSQSKQVAQNESSPSDSSTAADTNTSNNGALAMFALLCISLGANACLGWFARGFYVRYRELAEELRSTLTVAA